MRLGRIALVALIMCSCVVADLGAKSVAREALAESPPRYYLGGLLRLSLWENAGTFMSAGTALPARVRFWSFTVFVGLLTFALVAVLIGSSGLKHATVIAGSLIAGGSLSNIIDRLLHDGRVLDFINILITPLHLMIFNLADVAIALGATVFAVTAIRPLMRRLDPRI